MSPGREGYDGYRGEVKMARPLIGYYNVANMVTLSGLLFALVSCYFALSGDLRFAVIFLVVAGVCDLFDGPIARKSKRTSAQKEFGIQLDTVVDVVSFCVTPVLIVYSHLGAHWHVLLICAFYLVCGVIRLAYFTAHATQEGPTDYYTGLPVAYASLLLPIVLLFQSTAVTLVTLGLMGLLFILAIKVYKPRGVWYVLFPLIAVALIAIWWFV